jgi:UDP-glucose 4-epimerase
VNAGGSIRLAEAAAGTVDRFIHMSTILVHGSTTDGRLPFCEDDALRPASAYAHSKAKAEDGLRSISARTGLSITILRPPLIYGQGAKGNFARLSRLVRSGVPLPFKTIANRRAFAAGENVADLVAHCVQKTGETAGTLIVADREQVSTAAFTALIAQALGRRSLLFSLSPSVLRRGLEALGKARLVDSLLSSLEVDLSKVEKSGWAPVVGLAEGLRRSFDDTAERSSAGPIPPPPSR